MYYSAYDGERLAGLAADIQRRRGEVWCIFDNTTLGAAAENALTLIAIMRALEEVARRPP